MYVGGGVGEGREWEGVGNKIFPTSTSQYPSLSKLVTRNMSLFF